MPKYAVAWVALRSVWCSGRIIVSKRGGYVGLRNSPQSFSGDDRESSLAIYPAVNVYQKPARQGICSLPRYISAARTMTAHTSRSHRLRFAVLYGLRVRMQGSAHSVTVPTLL